MSVHEFTMDDIEGQPVDLSDYEGDVLLFVNVASQCGFTPQYKGLQELYEEYHDQGFQVLGFPANNFGAQEPGTNREIQRFCQRKYDVTFPMFAKISVKGPSQHPLYTYLTSQIEHEEEDKPKGGEVSWNFNKFLVGKDGEVIKHFDSKVKPSDSELRDAIESAL